MPNAKSGSVEAVFRGSPRVAAVPLQLREATPGLEVRARSPDTGHAVWVDREVADIERNLLLEKLFVVAEERPLRAVYLDPTGELYSAEISFIGLTTIDDGSTAPLLSNRVHLFGPAGG
jgi:hypothetical protein